MVIRELLTRMGILYDPKGQKKADKGLNKTASLLKKVAALAATSYAVKGLFNIAEAASDAAENVNVLNSAFGDSKAGVESWAQSFSDSAGRSVNDLLQTAGGLGSLLAPMLDGDSKAAADMSTKLAELSVDLGSFYNVAESDTLTALKAALVGSSEPMRKLGVNMTQGALQAYALEHGVKKQVSAMSEAEVTTLRYNFLLDKTKIAQGDATKTSGGYANQIKRAKGVLKDLKVTIGKELLPAFTDLLKSFSGSKAQIKAVAKAAGVLAKAFGKFIMFIVKHNKVVLSFLAALGAVQAVQGIMGLVSSIIALGVATEGAAFSFSTLWIALAPIAAIVAAVIALGALIYLVYSDITSENSFLVAVWEVLKDAWQATVDGIATGIEWVVNGFKFLYAAVSSGISSIITWFSKMYNAMRNYLVNGIKKVWGFYKSIFSTMFGFIIKWIKKGMDFILKFANKFEFLKAVINSVKDTLKGALDWILSKADWLGKVLGFTITKKEEYDKTEGKKTNKPAATTPPEPKLAGAAAGAAGAGSVNTEIKQDLTINIAGNPDKETINKVVSEVNKANNNGAKALSRATTQAAPA